MNNFETIYNNHYLLLHNVANKMVNDSDIAADIVQEVFIYLYQKMEKGISIHYPKSWLYKATINKCVDQSRKKIKFIEIEDSTIEINSETEHIAREKHDAVRHALSLLSAKERTLAVLYSEGLAYKEISEITGIKLTSVGKTLTRTLEKLGKHLKNSDNELYQ